MLFNKALGGGRMYGGWGTGKNGMFLNEKLGIKKREERVY
jgi:hypothetical protein